MSCRVSSRELASLKHRRGHVAPAEGKGIVVTVPLEVDCQAVKRKLDAGEVFLFLDCREPGEYATAKIAGTVLIPMSELTNRVSELESHKDSEIIVHCHHGGRSLRVTNWLRQQGFAKASNMSGGIDEWSQSIDPAIPRY
ncbi:MAG: rhodanese [Planctomycetes bacterium]|nr:rhodanese [Planctomycetota bacterium]